MAPVDSVFTVVRLQLVFGYPVEALPLFRALLLQLLEYRMGLGDAWRGTPHGAAPRRRKYDRHVGLRRMEATDERFVASLQLSLDLKYVAKRIKDIAACVDVRKHVAHFRFHVRAA